MISPISVQTVLYVCVHVCACELLAQVYTPSWYFHIFFELWPQDSRYEHERVPSPLLKCKMLQQKRVVMFPPSVMRAQSL